MDVTATFSATPYGQACMNCSRAKCKCMVSRDEGACERCHRLNKDCRPSQKVRKLKPLKNTASKTSRLEEKLDGLMSMLQSNGQAQPHIPSFDTGISGSATSHYSDEGALNANLLTPITSSPQTELVLPTDEAEQDYLDSFRLGNLQWLPFMHIPSSTSATHLKRESPFLWHCITAVQCKNTAQQAVLGQSIRELTGKRLLLDCEKSLDLLQGLLVWLGWAIYQSQPQKSSLCMFTQLAMGLVFDLGLNKRPPKDLDKPLSHCNAVGHLPSLRPRMSTVRTMNERRAVLSCFLISSSIAQFLGTMDPLRWTPHMTECLNVLAESNETSNDAVLVQLIRTQLIVDAIFKGPWNDCEPGSDEADAPRAPPSFYTTAIQSRLEGLKSRVSPNLQQNTVVLLYLHHTEVSLYETALARSTAMTDQVDMKRIDNLYACLTAAQKWLNLWFNIPSAAYVSLPFTLLIQASHCFVTLFRLSTFSLPGWDQEFVRNTVDILSVADQMADKLHEVAEAAGIQKEGSEGDAFSMLARMIRVLKTGWSSRLSIVGSTNELAFQNWDQWFTDSFQGEFDGSWFMDALGVNDLY